jgi:hypothetical protein
MLALVFGCSRPAPPSAPSAAARGTGELAAPAPVPRAPRLSWDLPQPQGHDLHAVTAGAQGVFAAGDAGTILRRDNGQWRPEASGTRADLFALHAMQSDGSVWAAGASGTLLRRSPGGSWERVATNTPATLRALFSCTSKRQPAAGLDAARPPSESLLAVGSAGTLLRIDAGRVAPLLPGELPKERDYTGIWGTSCEDLFIAERSGIWHIDGRSFSLASSTDEEPVRHIIGSSSGLVLAAGDKGRAMMLKQDDWHSSGDELIVNAFAGSGLGPFARVGERGAIEVTMIQPEQHQLNWEPLASQTVRDLSAAAFAGPRELYAVGQGGVILRWNGKQVIREQLALTELALLGVARFGDSLIAVGEEGTIL